MRFPCAAGGWLRLQRMVLVDFCQPNRAPLLCFAEIAIVFGWRHADCAAKPIVTIAIPDDAFKNRHGSVLGRGLALPLGKSSRPGSSRRGDARGSVGPAGAAVPAQSR